MPLSTTQAANLLAAQSAIAAAAQALQAIAAEEVQPPAPAPAPAPAGSVFASVVEVNVDQHAPALTVTGAVYIDLHGSGGGPGAVRNGARHEAALAAGQFFGADNRFQWTVLNSGSGVQVQPSNSSAYVRAGAPFQDFWMGYTEPNGVGVSLYTERRLDAMLDHIKAKYPGIDYTRCTLGGGSMGGWGCMSYGIRRPHLFAALYASRPRVRYCETVGSVRVPDYATGDILYPAESAPQIVAQDGGGSVGDHLDIIQYVSNPANEIPFLTWSVGWADGYTPRSDHVALVAALRATGRGFCFAWNSGGHGEQGSLYWGINAAYPPARFKLGQGYPVFTEHSLDANPATAAEGGINYGLSFRNVVETATGWSCEVTHVSSACTVKVKPYSKVFAGNPAPKLVTITAPNVWQSVSFSSGV